MRFRLFATSTLLILGTFSPVYASQTFSALAQDNKTIGVQVKIQNFSASDARQIKASGFGFVRFGVWTNSLENPSYQRQINAAFAAAKSASLPVLMTVRSTKALTHKTQSSGSDLAAAGDSFANAVIGLETTFGSQLVAIEIWNEPDLPKYWPTQEFEVTFVPFMSAVCNALQKRDLSTPLIGFGFAKAPTKDSRASVALTEIIRNYPQCLSAISYHPYGMSGTEISNTQAFILDNFHVPGVITEWGVPSLSSIGGTAGQASRITRFISDVKKLNIPLTSLYEWKNSDSGSNDRERSFGILSSDGKSKPAEAAIKMLLK
ncbi:glycosyl hydrolase family 5 [Pseudomonas sp.]|uniref:glycosyl hydrolase family 5 n=1 Tax=Pseudomonas sp. TaxID=306 RepID=UPI003F3C83C6